MQLPMIPSKSLNISNMVMELLTPIRILLSFSVKIVHIIVFQNILKNIKIHNLKQEYVLKQKSKVFK